MQWKTASITPIPKIPIPLTCNDFRPISLTPILCRVLEKLLLTYFIYPSLPSPSSQQPMVTLADQLAYKPSGSTTAALIALLEIVSNLLDVHPYVHVISCDFSKAFFNTVKHSSLMSKITAIPIPDSVHNWLADFLTDRNHFTRFQTKLSSTATINAGVVLPSVQLLSSSVPPTCSPALQETDAANTQMTFTWSCRLWIHTRYPASLLILDTMPLPITYASILRNQVNSFFKNHTIVFNSIAQFGFQRHPAFFPYLCLSSMAGLRHPARPFKNSICAEPSSQVGSLQHAAASLLSWLVWKSWLYPFL